jgi:hypothetical protein
MRRNLSLAKPAVLLSFIGLACSAWSAPRTDSLGASISSSSQTACVENKPSAGRFYIGCNASHMLPGIEAGYFFPTSRMRVGVGVELLAYNPFRLADPPLLPRAAGAAKAIVGSPKINDVFSISGYARTLFFYPYEQKGILANATLGADMELWLRSNCTAAVGFDIGDFRHIHEASNYFLAAPHVAVRYLF